MSFANLKRQSSNMDKLTKAIEAINTTSDSGASEKEKYWRPEVDKAGNGQAIIRFLPCSEADGEDGLPWVKVFSHGFQGPGGWLIDNCLTTKNKQCPVCEHNSTLWNSGIEANKDIVRKQKRKLNYIANVFVVSDPKHPENEGQVKLFKFGKKIFDKITEAMQPEFDDETPINPFDMWKGANFKLKIRKVEGYQNYDKSEFDSPSALSKDDDELEKIWKSEYSLKELIADSEFKEYDLLKKRLDKVLGLSGDVPTVASDFSEDAAIETFKQVHKETVKEAKQDKATVSIDEDDEDSALDYFRKMAEED
jgi:hypothetical protein